MHAVIRETTYRRDQQLTERSEFKEFQKLHASRRGYKGTLVAEVGDGRYITLTLWETADDMQAAREALEPVVSRLLGPLMIAPSRLYGTGQVAMSDIVQV